MRVISLFDRSGVMVEPFAIAGYDVLTIDIEPAKHNYPSIQADIRDVEPQRADTLCISTLHTPIKSRSQILEQKRGSKSSYF